MSEETFSDLIAQLRAFRDEHLPNDPSNRAIARALKVSPETVGNWLKAVHFPDQDPEAAATMVRMIAASAARKGIGAPDGLLDADRWREAHRAEALRRASRTSEATTRARAQRAASPGIPLSEATDPFAFEVHHPVEPEGDHPDLPPLPPYVPRPHDKQLASLVQAAANGRSALAVLVGGSSTGKTRALWETLKPLNIPNGPWRLWHPVYPTPASATLNDLPLIAPHTILWLNEAQRYLDSSDGEGEKLAAALRELLRDPDRAPILILATLWPADWRNLTERPSPAQSDPHGVSDPHAQSRELLSGHDIIVPQTFSEADLRALAETSDPRLAQAAELASADRKITQFLAGAPELLSRYHTASPVTKALITAAMDARRLGMGEAIPLDFLKAAAPAYLDDEDCVAIEADERDDWLKHALAEAGKPAKGTRGPLTQIPTRGKPAPYGVFYRLADYLDQYGRQERRTEIPETEFWDAATLHAAPDELRYLAHSAWSRGLLRHEASMYKRAALHGDAGAAASFANSMRRIDADMERLSDQIIESVALDQPRSVSSLIYALRKAGASHQLDLLLDRDLGPFSPLADTAGCMRLAENLVTVGGIEAAVALLEWLAANASLDNPYILVELMRMLAKFGDRRQLAMLIERSPADQMHFGDDDSHWLAGIVRLAIFLADIGEVLQMETLVARIASSYPASDPGCAARLAHAISRQGPRNGHSMVVVALASDLVARANLDDPDVVAPLLRALEWTNAEGQIQLLLQRDPAATVSFNEMKEVAELFDVFSSVGAKKQVRTLLARGLVEKLDIEDASVVVRLLETFLREGAEGQIAALLARDPASHVLMNDLFEVVDLFRVLREVRADAQVASLAGRAAAEAPLEDIWVGELLRAMREIGAEDKAAILADRLFAEGKFQYILDHGDNKTRYRFGRAPDGTPAQPWGWDDLIT